MMPNVKSTRYYENFDIPSTEEEAQAMISEQTANRAESPQVLDESTETASVNRTSSAQENNKDESILPEAVAQNSEPIYDIPDAVFATESSQGEIAVQALTARGTRPVSEAAVIIYKNRADKNDVVSFYLTDADGRTPSISVSAPPKETSLTPSSALPFADYNITVRHPMYYTAVIDNVQVFGSELTIQTVELIPLPEFVNERDITKTVIIPKQNL